MNLHDRVWWTDPDNGKCSQRYTVIGIIEQGDPDDNIYQLRNGAGGYCEAYSHELKKVEVL